eukprot:3111290-Pyramimonas_sp.AAC.1
MFCPSRPLRLAFHGHPGAGGDWEKQCEARVISKGFEPVSSWRSCYYHPELALFWIARVDDFKFAGSAANAPK